MGAGSQSRRRTERSESAAASGKPSGARAPPKLLRVLRKFACGALRHGRAPGAQGLRRAFWRRKPRPPTEKDAVGGKGVAQTSAAAQSPHRFPCSADTLPCRFSHSRHGENNAHPSAPLRGGKNPCAINPVSRTSVIKKQVRQRHAAERQAKPAANRAERERRHKRKAELSESAATPRRTERSESAVTRWRTERSESAAASGEPSGARAPPQARF